MRCRAFVLSSLLIVCLMWTNSAFSQTMEDEVAAMKSEIADMKAVMESILAGRRAVDRLLADAIVLTDQDCAALGPDWKRYEGISGRFPLGAGENEDRGEKRTFSTGQGGGEYRHELTVEEMPKHKHSFRMKADHVRGDHGDDWPVHHGHWNTFETAEAGESQPHNNMPPYLVMNFCRKAGNP